MPSDSTVPDPTDDNALTSAYAWDWSATTHNLESSLHTPEQLLDKLRVALGSEIHLPGKGLQGWRESIKCFDAEGYKVGQIYYGGRMDLQVVSSSSAADRMREQVVSLGAAKTARVDTRVDSLVPFDVLASELIDQADSRTRLRWVESMMGDGTPTGRTLYVGSPTSSVQVRLYEKWLESPGKYEEGANRVEVQVRPPSQAKREVSHRSRAETFCASKLTRKIATALRLDVVEPEALRVDKGTPDLERTLAAMAKQYGPGVRRWLGVSGGDWGAVQDRLLG